MSILKYLFDSQGCQVEEMYLAWNTKWPIEFERHKRAHNSSGYHLFQFNFFFPFFSFIFLIKNFQVFFFFVPTHTQTCCTHRLSLIVSVLHPWYQIKIQQPLHVGFCKSHTHLFYPHTHTKTCFKDDYNNWRNECYLKYLKNLKNLNKKNNNNNLKKRGKQIWKYVNFLAKIGSHYCNYFALLKESCYEPFVLGLPEFQSLISQF